MCIDRSMTAADKTKEYVQPQYFVDCLNALFLLPTKPYSPGIVSFFAKLLQPAPAHLSPFISSEELGYMPDRQREINALAGIETQEIAPLEDDEDIASSEDEAEKPVTKNDVDTSSDEESEDEEEAPKPKKGKAAKAVKKEELRALTKAELARKNEKLKADLKKEQQELGKMVMTKRQRKLFQEAEKTEKTKKEAAKVLLAKKKKLAGKK